MFSRKKPRNIALNKLYKVYIIVCLRLGDHLNCLFYIYLKHDSFIHVNKETTQGNTHVVFVSKLKYFEHSPDMLTILWSLKSSGVF